MSSPTQDSGELTAEEKMARKREKMKRLQRERNDPVAEAKAKREEEERLAEERRLAEEAAARKAAEEAAEAAAKKAAEEEAARLEAELQAAEEAAARRVYERAAAAEERRRQRWLDEEAKKVMFGRHANVESLNQARDSSLMQGSYMRYLVVEDNWQRAERARAQKEELLYQKEENAATWSAAGKVRAQERYERQNHRQAMRKEMEERSRRQAREARKALEASRRLLQKQREEAHNERRERVRQASTFQARLDAVEQANADAHRKEGRARREEILKAVAAFRKRLKKDKQQVVHQVQASFAFGSTAELTDAVVEAASRRAETVRRAERAWKRMQNQGEQAYMEQASEKRALVVAQRGNTRDAVADSLEERKVAATNLRKTNKLVKKEAARRRKQGQQLNAMAADIYRSRFASKEAAAAYDSSEWMNLTAWFVPRDPPPVEQPRLTQKAPEEAAAEEAEGASLEA